ncbi:MAG: 30S ribosomal protein S3 [Patescibacteria group bacterium]|nr:30S ribosomal protein S3 [Patescibacteria group bacterium]
MGHKVNPIGFRTGPLLPWNSRWFAKKDYGAMLRQDIQLRKFLIKKLREAGLAKVEVERTPAALTIILHAAKPGMIIGRGGQGIEQLKHEILQKFLPPKTNVTLTVQEVANPNLSAELVAQSMVADLEKRLPFRRVMKQAISRVTRAGAQGAKVVISGRLNGAEIARTEKLVNGKMPLHTLRADIDYSRTAAFTTYGALGVKVWIYKGERFAKESEPVPVAVAKPAVRQGKRASVRA